MKKLLVLSLIVFSFLLIGCGSNSDETDNLETTDNAQVESMSQEDLPPKTEDPNFIKDVNEFEAVLDDGKLKDCEKLEDKNVRATCILQVTIKQAKEDQDEKVCESLENEEDVSVCKTSMLM